MKTLLEKKIKRYFEELEEPIDVDVCSGEIANLVTNGMCPGDVVHTKDGRGLILSKTFSFVSEKVVYTVLNLNTLEIQYLDCNDMEKTGKHIVVESLVDIITGGC